MQEVVVAAVGEGCTRRRVVILWRTVTVTVDVVVGGGGDGDIADNSVVVTSIAVAVDVAAMISDGRQCSGGTKRWTNDQQR